MDGNREEFAEKARFGASGRAGRQTAVLMLVVVLAYLGQNMLNAIMAPLARTIGLAEWHVGAIVSTAALVLTLLSPFWGKRAQRIGPKRALLFALAFGFAALAAFALVAAAGAAGVLAGGVLVAAAVLTRGVVYGAAISAVIPTSQSYLVSLYESEAARVKAVGMLGAMTALAGVLGAVFAGLLSMAGGIMAPLWAMPLMMLAGIAVLAAAFKPAGGAGRAAHPKKVSYLDKRVFAFLLAGFALFLAFSALSVLAGFAVQDRLALSADAAAAATSLVVVAMSAAMIAAQTVLVPKTGWSSRVLLRVGFAIGLAAAVGFFASRSLGAFAVSAVLAGLGMGFAMPGYMTGPTMNVGPDEQGGLAGLISANNGATYIVAPLGSTMLYGMDPAAPFAVLVGLFAFGLLLCFVHPALRPGAQG